VTCVQSGLLLATGETSGSGDQVWRRVIDGWVCETCPSEAGPTRILEPIGEAPTAWTRPPPDFLLRWFCLLYDFPGLSVAPSVAH
jgi:hypothetical protein